MTLQGGERFRRLVFLQDAEKELLRESGPQLTGEIPRVTRTFYDQLGAHPGLTHEME